MTWNYRVMRDGDGFGIFEVYYEDGEVTHWTESAVAPYGYTLQELRWDVEHMLKALDKPVVEESDDA